MELSWKVFFSRDAKKQYKNLSLCGQKKPSIIDTIDTLALDLRLRGPLLKDWPNYGPIHESKSEVFYHCHLKKGKPTFVACWRVTNLEDKNIEIFYVGTHEKAPY